MTSILGISAFYHDSAAALIIDGEIISAAQEERFSRKKHDSRYPFNAVEFVLNHSNLKLSQIDYIVFLIISFWPTIEGQSLRFWSLAIALIFLVFGLLNSKLLSPFNLIWVKFGEVLGRIIAPIAMSVVYFIIITPIGLFMRLIGKDLLRTKFSKNKSYWIKREQNIGSMKRQF